jgi:hypothetical protein
MTRIGILMTIAAAWLLLLPLYVVAQSSDNRNYLVLDTGEVLHGVVDHIDQRRGSPEFYKKIRITDASGRTKKYKRKEIAAFRVNNTDYEGFWLSQTSDGFVLLNARYDIDSKKGERHFLRVVSKGKLSHYELEWWNQGDANISWMDLLKKEGDTYFMRATQGIFGLKRKVLTDYFSACPALKAEIENKQIKKIQQVVDFYNSKCVE